MTPGFRLALCALLLGAAAPSAPGAAPPAPDAQPATPAAPPTFAGSDACLGCHAQAGATFAHTAHARAFREPNARDEAQRRGCEACHGPGGAHASAGGLGGLVSFRRASFEDGEREDGVCLGCHAGGHRTFWEGGPHAGREVGCTSCHSVMKAVSPRGLLARSDVQSTCAACHLRESARRWRNHHMPSREGAMTCTSCHQPHGGTTPDLLVRDSVNEVCFACHADKRGPFLWEHAPVAESCSTCHDPHGSNRERMLVQSQPRLCQSCHLGAQHPREARLPASRFVIGHSCVQCHPSVHGSNHPSGEFLVR